MALISAATSGRLEHFQEKWKPVFRFENATTQISSGPATEII
jgi:hypothetical protein